MNTPDDEMSNHGRAPNLSAKTADTPLVAWARSLSTSRRASLISEIVRSAATIVRDSRVRQRVDGNESALAVSLFFAYARAHNLGAAEVEALLERPGSDGIQALEVLGMSRKPLASPGRTASRMDARGAPRTTGTTPGRNENVN